VLKGVDLRLCDPFLPQDAGAEPLRMLDCEMQRCAGNRYTHVQQAVAHFYENVVDETFALRLGHQPVKDLSPFYRPDAAVIGRTPGCVH
jgi:hypothetical protein